LRQHGLRITAARQRLVRTLVEVQTPLGVEAIHQLLGLESFDLVTLYRNLTAFEEAGVLQVVRDRSGKALYEVVVASGHHHHVICRLCGKVDCLDECHVASFEKSAVALGYADISHRIELYGVCPDCRGN